MKKRYVIYIFSFILILMFFIPNKVHASTYDYTIQSYDIDMKVNENNSFDITEKITAYFYIPKHGIYRKIPLRNNVQRLDGTTSKNVARISNIRVSEESTKSKLNGYETIKIGNSSQTYTGVHSYTISYTYDIGKDPIKDADELYFNLIGNEWDTSIGNVTFKITMPKSFDESKLGFSSGKEGYTDSSNVSYRVNGNIIAGQLFDVLNEGEALTVRLTLPEGYFVNEVSNTYFYSIFVMILSLIFVLIAYTTWFKYGKDNKVVETVEFYPPEGYNSAEVAYLFKGKATNEGIISLLIYLADKGYLKIEETEKKGIFHQSKGFKIIKLKEYDGEDENEKLFMKGLFKENRTNTTAEDLYDEFYITLNRIKDNLNDKENEEKIFEKNSSRKIKGLVFMIIAIFLLITIKPVIEYGETEALIFAIIFPIIGLSALCVLLFGRTETYFKVFGVIWGLFFGGIPWAVFVLPALQYDKMYAIMNIVGFVCIVIIGIFTSIMPKRTPLGNEMLGKIRGFKRFLETAEKPKLESLVQENPEYFYNILPYTYALSVSNVWMKQFEEIAMQAPDWYGYNGAFMFHDFNNFMNDTMRAATSSMSSSPSSSGDSFGGSSGGGFSGGGSGGGGGGSW